MKANRVGDGEVLQNLKLLQSLSKVSIVEKSKDNTTILDKCQLAGASIYLDRISGLSTIIHEHGHKLADELFHKGTKSTIQIDAIDNIKAFIREPNIDNLIKVLTKYDVGNDKFSGWIAGTNEGLSDLGRKLGKTTVDAIGLAAGCGSTELLGLIAFTVGYKIRKEHPVAGFVLMSYSAYIHIVNSVYAFSPIITPIIFGKDYGGDWIAFSKVTGLHPAVAAITMSSLLPALFIGLKLVEHRAERKLLRRQALFNLLGKEIPVERLQKYFKEYRDREKLERLSAELYSHLKSIGVVKDDGSLDPSKLDRKSRKLLRKVQHGYTRFLDSVIDREKELIDVEVQRMEKGKGKWLSEEFKKLTSYLSPEKLKEFADYISKHKLKALGDITSLAGIASILMTTTPYLPMIPLILPFGLLTLSSGLKIADKLRYLKANWNNMNRTAKAVAIASLLLSIGVGSIAGTCFIGKLFS